MTVTSYVLERFPLSGTAAMSADFVAFEVAAKRNGIVTRQDLIERIAKKRAQHRAVAKDRRRLIEMTHDELRAYVENAK